MKMDKELALKALKMLDEELGKNGDFPRIKMIAGGGAAMVLAYNFPGGTTDVDAVPTNTDFESIKEIAESVGRKLNINHDWLNPYFQSFTIYLPQDSQSRLENIYNGKNLQVDALGVEDILIMKLMAGRNKDLPHTKHLLKNGANIKIVESRLEEMINKNLYKELALRALDLLDEYLED